MAAGELFRAIGMDAIADDPPPTEEDLEAFLQAGTAWVATRVSDKPIAYILVEVFGSWAHIEQVTVHPRYGGHGIGASLIGHVEAWAQNLGLDNLSLTTFRDVPWNAPYYERLGFRRLPETEWPRWLPSVVEREKRHGLAAWPRTVMAREVNARPDGA